MKLLIQAVAILLLVNSCGKDINEPAPLEQAQQVEQKEPDKQAGQARPRATAPEQEGTETPYQKAIRAKIKGSRKDADSSDDKDKDSSNENDG